MSRRSRRRGQRGSGPWFGRLLIGMVLGGIVAAMVVFLAIRSYLHGDSFRRLLSKQLGSALQVDGMFEPFIWSGLAVQSDSYRGTGDGLVRMLRADGLGTEVGLGGLGRGVWEFRGSRVRRLEIGLDLANGDVSAWTDSLEKKAGSARAIQKQGGWLPTRAEALDAEIGQLVVDALTRKGPARLADVRLRAEADGPPGSYRIHADGGELTLPFDWLPPVRLRHADARWRSKSLFLNSLQAAVWERGELNLAGEWNQDLKRFSAEGGLSGVSCDELFNENWARRVNGVLEADFEGGFSPSSRSAHGTVRIRDGVLTALPMLDALAAYADTRRFRVVPLTQATADWLWKDDVWHFQNIVVGSDGLVRLEGGLSLRGREIDGRFRLGLPAGLLSGIPGAETHVFAPGEHGLQWTTLRITGTLDDPREDLTDRLIAAAGSRMFEILPETGERVIRFSRTLAGEAPEIIREGTRVIEQGEDVIRGATDLIDGILGGGDKPKPPPADEVQ